MIDQMKNIFKDSLQRTMRVRNVSANKLAAMIGIDRASISKYLAGTSSPRIDTFLAICEALDVDPNSFFGMSSKSEGGDVDLLSPQKIVESVYCFCKLGLIEKKSLDSNFDESLCDYYLRIYGSSVFARLTKQCLLYSQLEFSKDSEILQKIMTGYAPLIVEEMTEKLEG